MNWQPVIDGAGLLLGFWLWRWLIAATWVVHVIIGRKTFVRWMEALGWNGVMGFAQNLRDLLRGVPPAPQTVVNVPTAWTLPATAEGVGEPRA